MNKKIGIALALMLCLTAISVFASPIIEQISVRGSDASTYMTVREDGTLQSQGYVLKVDETGRHLLKWNTRSYSQLVYNTPTAIKFVSDGYYQEGRTRMIKPVTVTYNKVTGMLYANAPGVSSMSVLMH